jgi:hypothetical protein
MNSPIQTLPITLDKLRILDESPDHIIADVTEKLSSTEHQLGYISPENLKIKVTRTWELRPENGQWKLFSIQGGDYGLYWDLRSQKLHN